MTHLVPCPSCQRHVRVSETSCPFCSAGLSLANTPAPVLPTVRLSRAATFAFGATLLGASVMVACGGESEEGSEDGKGGSANGGSNAGGNSGSNSGGTDNIGGGMALYGAPPVGGTTGSGGASSGGASSGGASSGGAMSTGGFAGNFAPPYGIPPDAGFNDGGGSIPLYGAVPPPDGGFDDDGGGAQPEYGAPPFDGGT